MYVCGPTVDNLPHLGHGRFTLVWDVARRWLTFRGLEVTYVSNITDIDDKIIARAALEDRTTAEVVVTYEDAWWEAMDLLGVARPDESPHATDYVAEMIELIASFLERRRRLPDQRRRLLRRLARPRLRAARRAAPRQPARGRARRGQ